ncbi:hypothetical protein OG379_39900 (plasmid) [Streptomyces sp. NBC_01166]|uniref:hypothetical protein n=1 Tax=Streptomyces sp. NBC_01166 TaxID=2903755 RepID=UPI00386C0E6E|nr:hypothetical protein OG379_39900 [Streptomyces sp. NBC_01166]
MSRTRLRWASAWGVGSFAILTLSLAACGVTDDAGPEGNGGAEYSARPSTTAAPTSKVPSDWTEPSRWAALPRNERVDTRGNQVGFPQSTEGAVAMLAAASDTTVEAGRTAVDVQLGIYESYMAKADHSDVNAEKIELQAIQTDKKIRTDMGLPAGSALPDGAYVRSHVIGFQVVKESGSEVSAWLLSRVTTKSGETAKERGTYTRSLVAAIWEDSDWKLSSAATQRAYQQAGSNEKPPIVAPGDESFNRGGWTAIREAS